MNSKGKAVDIFEVPTGKRRQLKLYPYDAKCPNN